MIRIVSDRSLKGRVDKSMEQEATELQEVLDDELPPMDNNTYTTEHVDFIDVRNEDKESYEPDNEPR